MKVIDIKQTPEKELVERIKNEQEVLSHLKFRLATSQLESPIKIRLIRRDIARMKTILREKTIVKK